MLKSCFDDVLFLKKEFTNRGNPLIPSAQNTVLNLEFQLSIFDVRVGILSIPWLLWRKELSFQKQKGFYNILFAGRVLLWEFPFVALKPVTLGGFSKGVCYTQSCMKRVNIQCIQTQEAPCVCQCLTCSIMRLVWILRSWFWQRGDRTLLCILDNIFSLHLHFCTGIAFWPSMVSWTKLLI